MEWFEGIQEDHPVPTPLLKGHLLSQVAQSPTQSGLEHIPVDPQASIQLCAPALDAGLIFSIIDQPIKWSPRVKTAPMRH